MSNRKRKSVGNHQTDEKTKAENRINNWMNAISAQGTPYDSLSHTYYSSHIDIIDDSTLEALYAKNDLAKTIVERIVEDSLRIEPKFILLDENESGNDPFRNNNQVSSDIIQKWEVIEKVIKAAIFGRLYGLGGIFVGVDDGKKLTDPLEFPIAPDSLKFLEVLDKKSIMPVAFYDGTEPEAINDKNKIGLPKTYQLVPESSYGFQTKSFVFHESRMIKFGGARTSNRLKAQNGYADLSILQDKFDILRDIGTAEHAIHKLLQSASMTVYKVNGLHDQISQDKDRIMDLMRIVDFSKSTGRAIILDAGGGDLAPEEYDQVGAQNLDGAVEVLEVFYKRLATACRTPLTVLFGVSPAGLNATGESDSRHWFNQIESFQKDILASRLVKLMTIILQSEGMIKDGQKVVVDFPSLWEMDEVDKANIMKTKAETAKILVDSGILSAEEVKGWFV